MSEPEPRAAQVESDRAQVGGGRPIAETSAARKGGGRVSADRSSSPAALARNVRATSWYVGASVVIFFLLALMIWWVFAIHRPSGIHPLFKTAGLASASILILAGVIGLCLRYRRDGDVAPAEGVTRNSKPRSAQRFTSPFASSPFIFGVFGASAIGALTFSPLALLSLIFSLICLVHWRVEYRWQMVAVMQIVLLALWYFGWVLPSANWPGAETFNPVVLMFGGFLPLFIATSMWSWDVVIELNRARTAEARLAATQERLRLASELHDLQGHHLQVIALQLELAERLLGPNPAAAGEQIKLARTAVDAARADTRELANRYRGVPLPDELANAADLLRAAGHDVQLHIDDDAALAPADELGPIVRECTTNVLKHGGGKWARLGLTRVGSGDGESGWQLKVSNDVRTHRLTSRPGAGLDNMTHRMVGSGGDVEVTRGKDRFDVVVRVPDGMSPGRGATVHTPEAQGAERIQHAEKGAAS